MTDYLRLLYRRRRIALGVFGGIFLATVVYTFTATPVFQGRTQLLIESVDPNVVSFKDVVGPEGANADYYQTQSAILKSRVLARRTIDSLKLWNNPELTAFGSVGSVQATLDWLAGLAGGSRDERPTISVAGETRAQARAIDAFLRRLEVTAVRNSRLVDVSYQSSSRTLAATVPNTLAANYVAQHLEFRSGSARTATEWLLEQIEEQRKKVEASEQALQKLREQGGNAIALVDNQNIVVQSLADLNAAVTKARTDRIDKEGRYRQLQRLRDNPEDLAGSPAILSNTFLQALKIQLAELQRQRASLADRFGEKHPEMIKIESSIQSVQQRMQTEVAKVVQAVTSEYEAAAALETTLVANLQRQKAEALALNRQGIAYSVARREVDSNRQVYETLLQRAKETGISGQLNTSNVRVVDPAGMPRRPVRPDRLMNLLLGFFGGLLAGIALAFLLEYFDLRLKSPDEVERHLGVNVLGFIPGVSASQASAGSLLVKDGVPQSIPEMFRVIRNEVVSSVSANGPQTILVTSSQPREGKSLVASNLAMTLATTGLRVVLIDADMRKPRQHHVFNVAQDPGLSSILLGSAKPSAAMCQTCVDDLWVIPAGPNPSNPSELLGSQAFDNLLAVLRDHFDWIVIDTPPVLLVADAAAVVPRTTGAIFVVGSDQVSREVAMRAVNQLTRANANILGVVLNRVNVSGDPYYYSSYYQQHFQSYYGPPKETRLSA